MEFYDDDASIQDQLESEQTSPAESPAAAKVPRPYPSCDFCKRLKIKCERSKGAPRCNQCLARDAVCTNTVKPKKPRAKRQDHLSAMETRIRQMESVIAQRLEAPNDISIDPDGAGQGYSSKQVGISDNLSMIIINDHGGSQFVGSSSGFSLFSPKGLDWISKKAGDQDVQKLTNLVRQLNPATWDQGHWSKFHNIAWHPLTEDQREPIPRKEVALPYIEEFFTVFNNLFPLFNRETFNDRLERQYAGNPPTEPGWYACLNMVLAIGSGIIATSPERHGLVKGDPIMGFGIEDENSPTARYLRNATSIYTDLQFGDPTLMSVQAVLAMAVMLQGAPNPLATFSLIGTAVRLGEAIGFHRWLDDHGLTEAQADEQRNVFWLAYIIDKNTSIQFGRPSVIHDQDIGIALPKEQVNRFFPSGRKIFNTFNTAVKLAMIESRVYSELYSARSRTRTVLQRLTSIGKLDNELQKLRESIPLEIRPEHEIKCDERQLLSVLIMHYGYHNCITAIHRVSIFHGPWTSDPGDQALPHHAVSLNPRVYSSEAICVASARHVIKTLELFESERPPPMVWVAVSQPLSACLTLFANILQHPEDPSAPADLNLIYHVISMMTHLVTAGHLHIDVSVLHIFLELHLIAQVYLTKELQAKADKEATPNKVLQMVHQIENFSLPQDFQYYNQYSHEGTFNDDMLMLMGNAPPLYPVDLGEHYQTPENWYSPKDVQQGNI